MKTHIEKTKQHMMRAALLVIACVLLTGSFAANRMVSASSLEEQIREQIRVLEEENRRNRSAVSDLMATAASYQDAISKLQEQINQLQGQINENEAQKAELERQIAVQQVELEKQKAVLGVNIKAMYVDDNMSTIEMLATSKDLGEFVDKETYRNAVQRKIQETMNKITTLQNELNAKKQQIEILLESLQSQRAAVDASRAEQARLLAMNQQQQAEFNNKMKVNQAAIEKLEQQIRDQVEATGGGGVPDGGYYFIRVPGPVNDFNPAAYPYANHGFSMGGPGCGQPDPRTGQRDSTDRWGYCTRQCTSYAAWAVEASGRTAPRNYGNAKNWWNKAPGYTYREPKRGDVAVSTAGTWGHVMYVEAVEGNRMYVSQYNNGLRGEFSYQWRTWR